MRELVPKHEEHWFEIYGKIAVTGQPARFVNRAEQLHRWYDVYAFRFGKPEKRQVAILFNDITNRKMTEDALRQSEAKFRLIADNTADSIWIFDMDMHLLYISPSVKRMKGFTVEEMLSLSLEEMMTPASLESLMKVFDHEMVLEASGTADPDRTVLFETEEYCKSGATILVENSVTLIRDTKGRPVRMQGISRDITGRKQAEEVLLEAKERYRSLFDRSLDCVYIHDFEGNFIEANPSALKLLGYTGEEILSVNFISLLSAEQIPLARNEIREIIATGTQTESSEYRVKCRDGTYVDVETTATLLHHEGKPYAIQGFARDMTERKKAEEKLKKFNEDLERGIAERTARINASLEEKVVLLREIHHRVKNNLQFLISLLNLQSRTITDPMMITALKESTQRIRAMSIVHEKMYSGNDLAHIDFLSYLSSLATSQIEFYRLRQSKVTLEITGENIMLDINTAIPLGLVMNELLSNALKYAFHCDRLGIIQIVKKKTEGRLEITFADNGVGLPEGFDITTSQSLGLRLVQILVEQISGTIEIDRTAGTAFNFVVKDTQKTGYEHPASP
jgi:PAS domain S-box-containing protein